jgi:predicted phage-related endonuclease
VIADWYEREHAVKLLPGGRVESREHPWLWATLDRVVVGQNKLLEVKNVGSPRLYQHWDASSPDGVPAYVRAQVTIAMHVHGARECDVVASVGGRPPHVWPVFYDAELAELLVAGAVKFWALVTANTPPPLDATPATKAYLLAKYPSNCERVMRDADAAEELLGASRLDAAMREKAAAQEKTRLDAALLDRIAGYDGVEGDGWKMTWKLDKAGVRRQRFTATRGADE